MKKDFLQSVGARRCIWLLKFFVPIIITLPFMFGAAKIGDNPATGRCLGLTILMALWWIFEPVNLTVTSFLPLALSPILGIVAAGTAASAYLDDNSIVFMGGFIFSIAMVKWNLHTRIALKTVIIFGLRPRLLLLGICLVTWFLSMWISNTATALTLVPLCSSISDVLREIATESGGDMAGVDAFSKALLLGVAFSASIGGMATLIGTPVNLVLSATVGKTWPNAPAISFAQWFLLAFPLSLILIVIMYAIFLVVYLRKPLNVGSADSRLFREKYRELGRMKPGEYVVLFAFLLVALLWMFRGDIAVGKGTMKGWANIFPSPAYVKDGTAAMIVALLLYFIHVPPPQQSAPVEERKTIELAEVSDGDLSDAPQMVEKFPQSARSRTMSSIAAREFASQVRMRAQSTGIHTHLDIAHEATTFARNTDSVPAVAKVQPAVDTEIVMSSEGGVPNPPRRKNVMSQKWVPILDWKGTQENIPWSILFLMGGGFSLGTAVAESGLGEWVGQSLKGLGKMPLFPCAFCISLIVTLLSNITSNTATANIVLPIVAQLSIVLGNESVKAPHPWMLLIPATLSASMCFVLPIASPPNIIAMSSGTLKTLDFVTIGLAVNIIGVVVTVAYTYGVAPAVFGFKLSDDFPDWAK